MANFSLLIFLGSWIKFYFMASKFVFTSLRRKHMLQYIQKNPRLSRYATGRNLSHWCLNGVRKIKWNSHLAQSGQQPMHRNIYNTGMVLNLFFWFKNSLLRLLGTGVHPSETLPVCGFRAHSQWFLECREFGSETKRLSAATQTDPCQLASRLACS